MNLNNLKSKTWLKIISNKYVFVGLLFGIWMLFFDANSWLNHRELNQDKKDLLKNKEYYLKEIENDHRILENLNDSIEIEKFARQQYYMKRPDEEIFIIEYADSLER
ncbi:FtsB family cell division protein [Psychroflexus maritimus]|uniref:Septum formation initiator family protein n=1 Tax=Psychroflexus maritimus TaxID=2714865 RepID=A0A967DYC5_9FLAO|nr:septum formation initiator family protein [Psychroflexus maritimus]NGZ89675.1 septum formation initiator family protein [Psychroflexus maritimus]